MAKTKYQKAATNYAHQYLDKLLKMEDVLGDGIDDRIEQAVKKYMDELLQNSEKKI